VKAADIVLTGDEFATLDQVGKGVKTIG